MCLLVFMPENVTPVAERLLDSAASNPDGYGFAIVIPSENRILVEHTMDAKESVTRFMEARALYPEGPALWHSRYTTHGKTDVTNCHPFKVGGSESMYLGHNGVLPFPTTDGRSDTRVFAEDMLPYHVYEMDEDNIRDYTERYIGDSGSKMVLLTIDPAHAQNAYLFNEKAGDWEDDKAWYSNSSWQKWDRYLKSPSQWDMDDYDDLMIEEKWMLLTDDEYCTLTDQLEKLMTKDFDAFLGTCQACGPAVIDGDLLCTKCERCMDCNDKAEHCMCYTPASTTRNPF